MLLKARAIGLGLLVMLVVGAIASGTASAGPGPFWYHRDNPGENGLKIQAGSPEGFYGTGGPQTLKGTIAATSITLVSQGVKITGFIWNNNLQGQIKLRLKFSPIKVTTPNLPECQPEVFSQPGAHNVVYAEGHLAWKWNGLGKQLEEQKQEEQTPQIIFVPPGTQIQQGAAKLPAGKFAEIKFPTAGCGVLAGTFSVTESTVGHFIQPGNVNQWSNTLQIATGEGKQLQHFWNGEKFIGAEVGLAFGGNPSSFIGQDELETLRQEVSVMEN
jgi:hypothetical protein